jgi:hypothetical protein
MVHISSWFMLMLITGWKHNNTTIIIRVYTECNRRNGPNFGRVFLMLNYTEKHAYMHGYIDTYTHTTYSEVYIHSYIQIHIPYI